jgi:hypothetical protein
MQFTPFRISTSWSYRPNLILPDDEDSEHKDRYHVLILQKVRYNSPLYCYSCQKRHLVYIHEFKNPELRFATQD